MDAWTTPEAVRPFACWNATTAALVLGPKTPSTVSLAPCAFSRYCRERTVACGQALLLPWRSSGQDSPVAAVRAYGAAVTSGPAAAAPADEADTPAIPAASATARAAEPRT